VEHMMSSEFDDILDPLPGSARDERPVVRAAMSVPRLVARLYMGASIPLRAKLIACLLRPLGPLALSGVAAGAFAGFLNLRGAVDSSTSLQAAARVSSVQIRELAAFVEQVNRETLQRFADLASGSQLGPATFSASALVLLNRALHEAPGTEASASRRAAQ
jgi:hypothetical protein